MMETSGEVDKVMVKRPYIIGCIVCVWEVWIVKDVESVKLLNERKPSRVWLDGTVPIRVVGIEVSQNESEGDGRDPEDVW